MKTKKEILKMTKEELLKYKWSVDLNLKIPSGCSDCSDCSNCSDCSGCRNIRMKSRYLICNVQFTKEEYETKMKELKKEK